MQTQPVQLRDDGQVPNSPLPLLVYEGAFAPGTSSDEVIAHFAAHGWRSAWVNGIFDFHHYHARSHEVLANLGRAVTVQFGGEDGPVIDFQPGSAVVIPAGGGHCRLSRDAGLVIVGAYPSGQEDWDLKRADNPADYRRAQAEIPHVSLPENDPLTGESGPLLTHWQAAT